MKNKKNIKKGVTLILLLFVIAIIIILSTSVIITGSDALDRGKKVKFATELALVQEGVDNYKLKNYGKFPIYDDSNVVVSDASVVFNGTKDTTLGIYKEVDLSLIGITENVYGTGKEYEDMYFVSIITGNVYYLKGEAVAGTKYYTLKGDSNEAKELRESISYIGSDSNIASNDGISFTSSVTGYAREVAVIVRCPAEAQITTTTGLTQTKLPSSSKTMNITMVNALENGVITVTYNDVSRTYSVNNIDKDTPELEFNKTIVKIGDYSYVRINAKTDLTSEVNTIKYYYGNVNPETLKIRDDGYKVTNDLIEVKAGVQYITVYCEDKAGNSNGYKFKVENEKLVVIN